MTKWLGDLIDLMHSSLVSEVKHTSVSPKNQANMQLQICNKIKSRQNDLINGSTDAHHLQSTSGVTLVTEEMKKLSSGFFKAFLSLKVTVIILEGAVARSPNQAESACQHREEWWEMMIVRSRGAATDAPDALLTEHTNVMWWATMATCSSRPPWHFRARDHVLLRCKSDKDTNDYPVLLGSGFHHHTGSSHRSLPMRRAVSSPM